MRRRGKKSAWLDRLEAIVAGIYTSREGGFAYPLLTYLKPLLCSSKWYGLSDEGLEAAVDDRLSFQRFAGIPLAESVPDHSSIWRFREPPCQSAGAGHRATDHIPGPPQPPTQAVAGAGLSHLKDGVA